MSRNVKWILAILLLLPVAVGLIVLLVDADVSTIPWPGKSTHHAALVRIDGGIFLPEKTVTLLRDYFNDDDIAGVLLIINSPGGGVAASQEIYREVRRFHDAKKPLVVSMQSVAASGGYYVAAPAQKIFADAGTLTGSIGVIARWPRFKKLFDKVGIEMVTIKAGKYKDLGNPDREMTADEQVFFQNLLKDHHDRFIEDICAVRSIPCDSLRTIADGRVFSGLQACKVGLVDTIGNLEDAKDYLLQVCGLPEDSKFIEKKPRRSLVDALLPEELTSIARTVRENVRPLDFYYMMTID